MLTIKIVNDATGNHVIGSYDYKILINSWKVIAEGRIENFERSKGWKALVSRFIEQEEIKAETNKLESLPTP